MSTSSNQNNFSKGTDLAVIVLYMIMVAIGVLCIYMVEYNPNTSWSTSFITAKTNYSKQFYFAIFCSFIGIFILLMDSKVFTALANILYAGGILLMLATFVLGKNINGSKSWIPIAGGFNLQPAELCKIFTALFLAKFISKPETDFTKLKSHLIACAMIALPAILSIMQHELGLALVYSAFLFAMYREGLPAAILVIGLSFAVLVIAALLLEPTLLAIILTLIASLIILSMIKRFKRNKNTILVVIGIWAICFGTVRFVVPYIFNNVLECYQSTRIYSMVGKEYDCSMNIKAAANMAVGKKSIKPDDYNVKQSKIAIGSGGFWGRGFLKGTQTRGKYVPAQHTDFIFTSLGEAFGFVGTFTFLALYLFFLFRLIRIAERQRSTFSRVYAYSVVGIFLFHIAVNISMTIGLFPVVGIPLPLISYGGSSLLTFTALIFILLRLDADRQMVLR
ncbi:MAG: rod shape-determining protein RodA [Chitinophagaceae bacterium]|jgi:rod shape determining protein RodA|nr:rod shape-determining protein RodA [Sediminibacterium sp.]